MLTSDFSVLSASADCFRHCETLISAACNLCDRVGFTLLSQNAEGLRDNAFSADRKFTLHRSLAAAGLLSKITRGRTRRFETEIAA